MSDRKDKKNRRIHSKSLALIGTEACTEMLALARDLRRGAVPPEQYDQTRFTSSWCESACCIAGHLRLRASLETYEKIVDAWVNGSNCGLSNLFALRHPSNPQLAADAIERFVFDGSDRPWG